MWLQAPIIFITGAADPAHPLPGRTANDVLHVDEALTVFVQELNVGFELIWIEFFKS
jgi:hypothetical protein